MAREFGASLPYPKFALNSLDDFQAPHEVQRVWPDLVIDRAIGSDLSCQVSAHPKGEDVACLMCLFRRPTARSETLASRATRLEKRSSATAICAERHAARN